jgi:hypothetical protein
MRVTIEQAARILGNISAPTLRARIHSDKVLKIVARRPDQVELSDVLTYKNICPPPAKKGPRLALVALADRFDSILKTKS